MPLHRTSSRGRHAAARRHLVAPFLLTAGLAIGTTATVVGVPTSAHSSERAGAHLSAPARPTAEARPAPAALADLSDRTERLSRAGERTALTPPARVIKGKRLRPKPPPWSLPLESYRLTARFGQTGLWSNAHTGLDFAAPPGTTIRSVSPGTVASAEWDGPYGNKTVIRLDDGTELWYCHQTSFLVNAGERVAAGQPIGTVGATGNVTGPHLHLEIRPGGGDPIDPSGWLPERGVNP